MPAKAANIPASEALTTPLFADIFLYLKRAIFYF